MENRSLLIRVRENEYKPLLDRDRVPTDIKKYLTPWTDLLEDLTNYGSNLVPRCYSSSGRGLKDVVVLMILLRQAVAMLDGIGILLSQGAVHSAQLQLRALFEASVYIDWILMDDADKKAEYYYVRNLRRKRLWATRTQPGSPESDQFLKTMKESGIEIKEEVRESARRQITDIDRILSQPKFANCNREFNESRKRRQQDPPWYVPLGLRSLAAIARTVGKESFYLVLYPGASDVMHTSSYEQHIQIGNGNVTLQPVRSVEGFENVFRLSSGIALSTFRRILQEYRPEELSGFGRKYFESWQKEFMNFPKIKYEPETTTI
jgi:hypothetical protein